MHTGHPNPQSIDNSFNPGKLVLKNSNNKYVFPALNCYNNNATIDYEAQLNTKSDHTTNNVFHLMTVQD